MNTIILIVLMMTGFSDKPQETTTLVFTINGLETTEGTVYISIFDKKESFMKKGVAGKAQKVKTPNEITIIFKDLKPGKYAASVYHDINDNGELDSNWIGIPREPYGFSNNARGSMGPASFEDCLFEAGTGKVTHTITLK